MNKFAILLLLLTAVGGYAADTVMDGNEDTAASESGEEEIEVITVTAAVESLKVGVSASAAPPVTAPDGSVIRSAMNCAKSIMSPITRTVWSLFSR